MKHDILGEIRRTKGHGEATIRYGSSEIRIQIIPDGELFETTLGLAAEVVGRLEKLDKLAKRVAEADLRKTYNNGWNECDEVQADGSLKTVSNPKLSAAEFKKKLSLNAVNVTGNQMIDVAPFR
jgi:hypothetical protein